MTITCLHCGPVLVDDPSFVAGVRSVLAGLAIGHAPLGAITCPLCRDEVRSRDVRDDGAPFTFTRDGSTYTCAWHEGFDPWHPANRGASHGLCDGCLGRMEA